MLRPYEIINAGYNQWLDEVCQFWYVKGLAGCSYTGSTFHGLIAWERGYEGR